ncbi:MAG TPA: tetratricopeptide repeat-containing sensor histidine kinase, partial [Flavobacteriaceae bacterium]|nr:tetratricopeptide repeat-containing sensor histidine kinase [Flavobacteriaceae bacterium]
TYTNLGNLYSEQGDLNKGISYYHKSLDLSRQLNDEYGIAINFNNLGDSYTQQKQFEKAEFYFTSALNTAKKVGERDLESILYLNLSELKNNTGNFNNAIAFAVKGLDLAKEMHNIEYEADLYKNFAVANEGLNKDKTAISYYKLHSKLQDSITNLDKLKKVKLFKSLNELEEQQFHINRLAAENEIKDLKYESERKFVMGLIALVVVFGFMLILLINNQTAKKKAYNLLAFKNYQIHKMKDEIQEQRDNLNQLNLTKDRFFSIIAHDLKNPFNSIKGFTELLIENDSSYNSEKRAKFLKIIKGATNKASNLLSNLLIWANTQSGSIQYNPTKLNLKDVVASVFSLLEIQAINKDIEMVNTVDYSINVMADENMLDTILRNLLSNAIKFTNNNGKILVNASENSNDVTVEVMDNGVGISEEDKESLFKIDVKNSNVGTANEQGSGLGLILCKEFVDKHNGKIWVESESDKGSNFIFTIPKA